MSLLLVDFAFNGALVVDTFLPKQETPVVQLGVGSPGLPDAEGGDVEDGDTGGLAPTIQLYDAAGENFANYFGDAGLLGDGVTTEKLELDTLLTGGDPVRPDDMLLRDPAYMRLQAHDLRRDPICISYVTVTAVSGVHHMWHAGYAKQCDASLWYPSPKKVPDSDFAPGCIWLSNHDNDRFLQGVSFKLSDFAFPTSKATNAKRAKREYEEELATLCKAPARMAFWEKMKVTDCIPFYPFEDRTNRHDDGEVEDEEDDTLYLDKDLEKAIDGHEVPCEWHEDTVLKNDKLDIPLPIFNPAGDGHFGGTPSVLHQCGENAVGGTCETIFGEPLPPAPEAVDVPPSSDPADSDLDDDGFLPLFGEGDEALTTAPTGAAPTGAVSPSEDIPAGGTTEDPETSAQPEGEVPAEDGGGPVPSPATSSSRLGVGNVGNEGAQIVGVNPGGLNDGFTAPVPRKHRRARKTRSIRARAILEHREELRKSGDLCVDALTVSDLPEHSAAEVCGSHTSWGPDFVSMSECAYCDMCTREVRKVCGCGRGANRSAAAEEGPCFDTETRTVRYPPHLDARELGGLHKVYRRVEHWKV